ncbi:MAG: hypothetical protein ABUK11_06760 [Mariprofundaceae bacterium]
MITAVNIFIVVLIALFFPFMTLSRPLLKRYLLIAAALFIVPLIIALIGDLSGWFSVNFIDIVLLERGVFCISYAVGYGIIAGLLVNGLKVAVFSLFRKTGASEASQEE